MVERAATRNDRGEVDRSRIVPGMDDAEPEWGCRIRVRRGSASRSERGAGGGARHRNGAGEEHAYSHQPVLFNVALAEEEHMQKSGSTAGRPPSELIDERIVSLDDWRGDTLSTMRTLIKQADPDVVEEWKWRGTPVWSHDGIICTGESYKSVVKLTFAKGASLPDPAGLFNSSLDGNVRRAIDIREGEKVDAAAFKTLIRAAVALNTSR